MGPPANLVALAAIAIILLPGNGRVRADTPLSAQEIARTISGKRIYLRTPFGGEFPLHYGASGIVDGTGKALGLGRFMRPTDRGRWWVEGNRLCQQWETWYDGRRFCFTLVRQGSSELAWQRNDGLSGTARLGD